MTILAPPFSLEVLSTSSKDSDPSLLLPATWRTKQDDIIAAKPTIEFLEKELLVKRLNDVQDSLWLCGRPMPPRPLHHQRLLAREIEITEDPELHMVWWRKRIFIKPMPSYLLDPQFWRTFIVTGNIEACALGFLFSYTALIAYESDFRIAQEHGLLPEGVKWQSWKALTAEFLSNHSYDSINPRYWYGELRLSRLNKIYRLRKGFLLRGYSRVASHSFYTDMIADNFAILTGILGYVVIALSAMQVGLGVEKLQSNKAFLDTSYGLTIFSLIVPLIGAFVIFLAVIALFVGNWMATKAYEKRRLRDMGVGIGTGMK